MSASVKTRAYDASSRRAAAQERRDGILTAARALMLAEGYTGTTITGVAAAAGVSPETVYKAFGGKPGIAAALFREALGGAGDEPAEVRSDRLRGVSSGHELVAGWVSLAAEVAPRGTPLWIILRDAAVSDPKARELLDEIDAGRLKRMRANARALLATGDVRPDLSLRDVTDVLFSVSAPELYELLVLRRGWSLRRFSRFQQETMVNGLLVRD